MKYMDKAQNNPAVSVQTARPTIVFSWGRLCFFHQHDFHMNHRKL